ncbi:thiol reductant ABC exporter subunit CydD [Nakamurella silvestris]|nr:thiol reductant ABC exporter subunit CydD [Nakamurella silvestris]
MRPFEPRLVRLAAGIRGLLAVSLLLGVAIALATIVQAVLLAKILAEVIIGGVDLAQVTGRIGWLLVVVLLRAGLSAASDNLTARSAARIGVDLRARMVRQAADLGPARRGDQATAELSTLAGTGMDALEAYLSGYLPQLFLSVLVPFSVLWFLFASDLTSGLIVLGTLPLIPLFMALIGWYTQRQTRAKWRTLTVLSNHFADVVAGLPTLKAFGRAKFQAGEVRRVTGAYRTTTMATLRVAFLSSLVLELLATLSVALVAVAVGLRLVSGNLTLEVGLAVLILAPEAYLPLRTLGARFHSAADGVESARRIVEFLDTPVPRAGTRTDVATEPRILATDLVVGYPDAPVLGPLDLTLEPGRFLVVTGASGVGKSTLLLTLAGLLPPLSGALTVATVDGGRTALSEVDPALRRRRISLVGQRPFLVAGSVRENLLLGQDGPVDEALLWRALAAADAAEWVRLLPQGWDTILADGGSGLSAGQRQRLVVARALAAPTQVLLLDEPTSHLDTESELRVLAGIREVSAGRTVVLVTHRRAPLDLADELLDLGSGTPVDTAVSTGLSGGTR